MQRGIATRKSTFDDGTVEPVRVDYTQSPIDRLAIEVQSFINEENKITREQTSSTADDPAEDGSVSGPTIIRYYMPTETDLDTWHTTINGADHIDSPSTFSDYDKRIIESRVLSQFEKIANIEFEAVTDINTQRPDIVFMKGSNIKENSVANDALNTKTVIQEVTGIPGHTGTHNLPTIFFKCPNDVHYDHSDNHQLRHELSREIGYLLGLRNPTPELGDEGLSYLPYAEVNSFANTIYGLEDIQWGKLLDPQGYDIAALQTLYDPPSDTVWYGGKNSYEQYFINYNPYGNHKWTVSGGTRAGVEIDLTDGGYSGLPTVKYGTFAIDDMVYCLYGSYSNQGDNLFGNTHDNSIAGHKGADTMDGRTGIDEVLYHLRHIVSGINVDLRKQIQNSPEGTTTEATGDILINIENLHGTTHDDVFIGNNDHNRLDGSGGSDTLTGNGGRDTFVIVLGSYSSGHDIITDFERNIDKLEIEFDRYRNINDLNTFRAAIDDGDITLAYQTAPTPSGHAIKISYSYTDWRDEVRESSITIKFQDSIADAIDVTAETPTITLLDLAEAIGSVEEPVYPDFI